MGMTNMGTAILTAVALLKPQPAPTAIVMLTDGKNNQKPDPVKSADAKIRTYPVGIGLGTDPTILQQIATKTGAYYYRDATAKTLISIYFDIIGKAGIGQLVSNVVRENKEIRLIVPLQAGLPGATIGVAWPEPWIGYGLGDNQIQVTVLDPWSEPYQGSPVYLERGYVMFPIESPEQGDWTVEVKYNGDTPPAITAAAVDPTQTSRMLLNAPPTVRAGTPIVIDAQLLHENTAVKSLQASATAAVPVLSIGEAIDANRDALRSIDLSAEADIDSGEDPDLARFRLLHGARLATEDIFPHHTVTASVRAAGKGHELEIPTNKPGCYTVNVVSAGEHPNGGRFQRTSLVTVEVV
jgi:hypothetical protein